MARPLSTAPKRGTVFSYLTVTGERYTKIDKLGRNISYIPVMCKCGSILDVKMTALVYDRKRSCGCLLKELTINRLTKTGMSRTKEYRAWTGMLKRCYDPKYKLFHRYGGRGIIVCDSWKDNFFQFYMDVGSCPDDKTSLDRFPNNNGNYELGNVRWANDSEQCNNRSTCLNYEINGVTKTLQEWCLHYTVSYSLVYSRLYKLNWGIIKALKMPKRNNHDTNSCNISIPS